MTSTTSQPPVRLTGEPDLHHSNALPTFWQRLPALSGVAFAALLMAGFFMSGGDAPDYMAADQKWRNWAENNESKSRIGAFLILIAGFVFLHFAGTIRSVLGSAEATVRGSVQFARVGFAGALTRHHGHHHGRPHGRWCDRRGRRRQSPGE